MLAEGFYSSDMRPSGAESILAQTLGLWLLVKDKESRWFLVAYWIMPKLPGLSFKDPLAGSFMILSTVVYRCSHWKHLGLFWPSQTTHGHWPCLGSWP